MTTGSPQPANEPTPEGHADGHEPPRVDLTGALHEAGHEEELLGTEGTPDTGPILRTDGERQRDLALADAEDLGLHGQDGVADE